MHGAESPPRVSGFFWRGYFLSSNTKTLTLKVGVTVVAMSALSNLCRRILNNKGFFRKVIEHAKSAVEGYLYETSY